jgi:hypothetical protein
MNTNDTGYHKARAQSLSLSCERDHTSTHFYKSTSFAQPQRKCLLLFFSTGTSVPKYVPKYVYIYVCTCMYEHVCMNMYVHWNSRP